MPKSWIDVTVPLRTGMLHWPDNPPVEIERVKDIRKGASSNVSNISMGSHTGTHIDAPVHFIPGGEGIDRIDIDSLIGPARVIEIRDREAIRFSEVEGNAVSRGERILFRTRNSTGLLKREEFAPDFVYLTAECAERLVSIGVRTIGIDYLSVAGFKKPDGKATHPILLGAGVTVIEGLDLSGVAAGRYEMIVLPLRIAGGDASPARALLRPVDEP